MIFENKKHILSIFLTALMVFGTLISGYADENSAPVFSEDESTTRSVAENTAAGRNIGTAFTATDADNDTLTYTLSGTDAASFSIVSTSGQLQTSTALDFETKSSYSVTVSVSDGNGGSDAIDVTIDITNVNEAPRFPTLRAIRAIPENTASGTNIGGPLTATDPDSGDTLTYSLRRGDREAFQIDPNTGQLQTKAPLDYETKRSYTDLAVRATDSSGAIDAVLVTINVTDVDEIDENRAPSFAEGTSTTRAVPENTASGQNIGSAVSASDPDDDTLTYTLAGADAESFSIDSTSGQLQTSTALDFETKSSYSVTVSVSDGNGGSDAIDITIDVTNVNEAPRFPTLKARFAIPENTASGTNIGGPLTATDPDSGDTLTYSLRRGDREAFQIDPNTGQLQTKAPLDYETKRSYTDLAVRATDSSGAIDGVLVTINITDVDENRAPSFTEGNRATRSVAENTRAGQDIGSAVSATDPDDDTLTYTLGGTDAAMFSIVSANGQLQTRAALNYETKTSYSVIVSVSDGDGSSDSINVTIDVTDVYEPIIHRTQQVQDAIVAAVPGVNHADYVTVAHLAAITRLDLDAKGITSLKSGDFNELPALTDLDLSRNSIRDISALANLTALTDLNLRGNSISNISALANLTALKELDLSNNTSISDISVLRGLTALTHLHLKGNSISNISALEGLTALTDLYLKGNPISNYGPLRRLIAAIDAIDGHPGLTLDINIPPVFTEGTRTTRAVAENTAADTNIGSAVSATDPDNDTLTYTLGGADAASLVLTAPTGN